MSGALVWLWLVLLPPVNTAELTRYADQTGTISALNAPDERMTTEVSPFRRRAQPVWLSQHELRHTIRSAARQHRLSPALLWAVIKAESNFNAVAVSAKGALGLMQLMPATAAFVKIEDPLNPIENIRGGARYLRYLLNQFNEDLPLALAAYNAGPGHVRRNQGQVPAIPQTQDYVEKVLAFYDEFQSAPHQRSI
jgi:soluble lytic murein transglycosylase